MVALFLNQVTPNLVLPNDDNLAHTSLFFSSKIDETYKERQFCILFHFHHPLFGKTKFKMRCISVAFFFHLLIMW